MVWRRAGDPGMAGAMTTSTINVAETHPACTVLGPGVRYVIWVQGCGIGCRECISPQWIPFVGGATMRVDDLADRLAREAVDGVTFSGGEPFAQADALADLLEAVRARRDLSAMSYTGYTLDHLRRRGTPGQQRLLGLLDILVDGPFLAARLTARRWRGSSNQRLHFLTARHRELAGADDGSVGIQIEVGRDSSVRWLGVPAVAQFRQRFEQRFRTAPGTQPSIEERT
jgi:anaerobic ribonucleoside-triphosphate reductase activating protein